MDPILNMATRAARSAGEIILRAMDRIDNLTVVQKSRNDYVSEVDRMAEQEIIRILSKAYPDHAFLGEESGASKQSDYVWIIDPLDGTTNFLHGFPQFAVSIALTHKGRIERGVVFDPLRQEIFSAVRGGGATLNNRRLRVSKQTQLKGSLLGTGFPFRHPDLLDVYLDMFKAVHNDAAGIRRAGSAALDLAYVAAGRMDGFWEIALSPWDIAAGVLLVQEAGGIVTDFTGSDRYMENGHVLAATPKLHKIMQDAFQPHLLESLR